MRSFSLQGMKRHPALIPLVTIVGVGMAGAVFYTARLALRNPDVSWNKKTNPEPWQEFKNKQYKFGLASAGACLRALFNFAEVEVDEDDNIESTAQFYSTKDYSSVPQGERPEF